MSKNYKMALRDTLQEYKRVFNLTKKPTWEELKTIIKVTGLGILVIGLIGFLVFMIMFYIKGQFGIAEL